MRKAVKMQILELLVTLQEAHKEMSLCLHKKEYGKAINILADCQDCAVEIGNTIEQSEVGQELIISQLEEYCERLYEISSEIEISGKENSQKWKKELNKLIDQVQGDIKHNIKVILKVVFFPYKASMWTSLESIWKAADADEQCEVEVVVIPYFTLDSHGDKAEMKYEADLFPQYVPIVHYSQYNVVQEQPDLVFIHNPYDDTNNVTRVPEQYYSHHLKKYTEQLIYSPYGLMGYYNPRKGAFMCCTNAVLVADKILVQSERVKQIYMDYGIDRNKLLALGSPKIDAVVEGLKKPVIYPEGWEERLKGRKVFLVNTHLSYFIRGYINEVRNGTTNWAEWFHEKIWEQVLNRKECALIWRPHPLLKATLKSRNLYKSLEFVEYLEQKIKEADNAVLDENGEYAISFGISDALISTYSSIIPEYMISGKPIYIYEFKLNSENCKTSPVDYSNNYYFDVGDDGMKVSDFVQMILEGKDPLYEKRMEDVNRAFSNLDGTIGKEIYVKLKKSMLS